MKYQGKDYRAVWMEGGKVFMIDQNRLPWEFSLVCFENYLDVCNAIVDMTTRGAGSIGAAAGFAMAQAALRSVDPDFLLKARSEIEATRPTARNLFYAAEKVYVAALQSANDALIAAHLIADECAEQGRMIGVNGNSLIQPGDTILTHCNAGWLALVDYGSALAPVYAAHHSNKNIRVFVDETRPRSQGARLTAWELHQEGVPHHVIADNAAAYYMSRKQISLCITGADRIACNGDTANKTGTLSRAIAARHFGIPFYIAAPSSTFDIDCPDGNSIVIEERNADEMLWQTGPDPNGDIHTIRVVNAQSKALNPAFDVTPAELITAFITEKGIFSPNEIQRFYGSKQ